MAVTPAEIGRELGFPDALSTARAVRALIARKRLEPAQGSYRLLDTRPVERRREGGARAPAAQAPRSRGPPRPATRRMPARPVTPTSAERVVDRLVELGREVAEMRAALRAAREEAREAREARDEAESRARALSEKVRELEARAEMAESNLRTLLATARANASDDHARDARVSDSEMEAILGVLKGDERPSDGPSGSSTRGARDRRPTVVSAQPGDPRRRPGRQTAAVPASAQERLVARRLVLRRDLPQRQVLAPAPRLDAQLGGAPGLHDGAAGVEPAALGDARRIRRLARSGSGGRGRRPRARRRAGPSCTGARGAAARPRPGRSRRCGRGT